MGRAVAVAWLLCAAVEAGAVAPHLASVIPTGGQRGTQLEVSFRGDRLQDAEEIIACEPGVEVVKLSLVTNQIVKAQVKIAPDCRLGEHHLRVRTATGLSELRTFFVGQCPVVAEKEPNNEPATAQPVALNTTVTGVITSEDVDCFAVEVRQGDRLSAEVEGMRLGRGLFDPRLTVLDGHGTVLADVDDTQLAMQDPFVSLVAPADGTYILRLREATYGGNDDCHYRLHIGAFPRPTAVYPLGGKAGETLTLSLLQRGHRAVHAARETAFDAGRKVRRVRETGRSAGAFAKLDSGVRVSERAGKSRPTRTGNTRPPPTCRRRLALNGAISQKGEEDWFRFKATKGGLWR